MANATRAEALSSKSISDLCQAITVARGLTDTLAHHPKEPFTGLVSSLKTHLDGEGQKMFAVVAGSSVSTDNDSANQQRLDDIADICSTLQANDAQTSLPPFLQTIDMRLSVAYAGFAGFPFVAFPLVASSLISSDHSHIGWGVGRQRSSTKSHSS